jgi:hypothetical protein
MRSGLIFSVSAKFTNRYLLCRMLAASARKMHRDGVSTSQCINNSLRALQDNALVKRAGTAVEEAVAVEAKQTEALAP